VWWTPCLLRQQGPDDCVRVRLGDPVVDDYLEFVAARCRPNTVLATAYDLKVFFSVVGKEPGRVSTADVFGFLGAQRAPRRGAGVVRLEDGEAGLSARTIKRRLASVSGLFAYLVVATHNNVHWWWPVSVSTARCGRVVWAVAGGNRDEHVRADHGGRQRRGRDAILTRRDAGGSVEVAHAGVGRVRGGPPQAVSTVDTTSAASAATVCRPMSCGLLRPQRCGSSVFVVARRGSRDAQARRADETLDPVGARGGRAGRNVAP